MLFHSIQGAGGSATSLYPTFISSTTADSANETLSIPKPTGTNAGDLLIVVLVANGTAGWEPRTGWNQLNNILTDPSTSVQYRIADGTESGSISFTNIGDTRCSGTMMRFINAGNPFIGTANSSATSVTPQTAPSTTVDFDNSLQLSIFTSDTADITWTGVDGTSIVSYTTRCSFNIGYTEVNSGSTTADTATPNTASSYAAFQLVIPNKDSSPTLTYRGFSTAGASSSPVTYTSQPIGPATSDRVVFVITWGLQSATRSVTGITIGGESATLVIGNASAATQTLYMYRATVPTGTTADVVVTWSGSLANTGIVIYTASNFGTITNNTSNRVASTAATQSISLSSVDNGFTLVAGFRYTGSTPTNVNSVVGYTIDREEEGGQAAWVYGNRRQTVAETRSYSVTYSRTHTTATPFIAATFSY